MSDVFNTLFEVSLCAMLVLETAGKRKISTDMIAAVDFITVYGRTLVFRMKICTETTRTLAQRTWEFVSQKSERTVIELINRHSVSSVKRGETNG